MRAKQAVNVIVYHPVTAEGKAELSRRVSNVHADSVNQRIRHLNCPTTQKLQLLNAIIEDAQKRSSGSSQKAVYTAGRSL